MKPYILTLYKYRNSKSDELREAENLFVKADELKSRIKRLVTDDNLVGEFEYQDELYCSTEPLLIADSEYLEDLKLASEIATSQGIESIYLYDAFDFSFPGLDFDFEVRQCRVCGCTQDDCSQCVAKTGTPCSWVEYDLCSACIEDTGNQ